MHREHAARFELQQQQRLVLTPQVRQSLYFLQCSGYELSQQIEAALAVNPALEIEQVNSAGATQESQDIPPDNMGQADSLIWEASSGSDLWRDDEQLDQKEAEPSLQDHLMEQLRLTRISDRQANLVVLLIDELDENGYLPVSLEALAHELSASWPATQSEWQAALRVLQSLDPIGVGARSPSECLLLQIPDKAGFTEEVRACADQIAAQYLQLMSKGDRRELLRVLGCSPDVLDEAHKLLLSLDPKPGRHWASSAAAPVLADIVVRKIQDRWHAFVNQTFVPRLSLNNVEADTTHIREANLLIQQVQQRFDTVLRVAQHAVAHQQAYFDHGPGALKPLYLYEIAQALELHVSTISRAVSHKYIRLPWGVQPLACLFPSELAQAQGQNAVAAMAVRARILDLVRNEAADRPLSDQQIVLLLAEAGIRVARRTVVKYRQAEGIASSHQRRKAAFHSPHS